MPQIREQIAMVHLPPSKTLKYLFHVRKTVESLDAQFAFEAFAISKFRRSRQNGIFFVVPFHVGTSLARLNFLFHKQSVTCLTAPPFRYKSRLLQLFACAYARYSCAA